MHIVRMVRYVFLCALLSSLVAVGQSGDLEINTDQRLLEYDGEGSVAVGSSLTTFAVQDLDGAVYHIAQGRATAFVFLSTSCPLAKRYTQRLNRLNEEFADQQVALVGVFSNSEDNRDAVVAHAKHMKFAFPVVKDTFGYLARRLGAAMTPQAVVVDGSGVICYRGAIDDNRYEPRVQQQMLRDVLSRLAEEHSVSPAETKCLGCSIHLPALEDVEQVTYSQHVARILQDHCQACHRPNQVAPFSLLSYEDAKTWATEINAYAQAELMPPWKPARGFGEFQHEQRLTLDQLQLLDRWVKEGAVEGPAVELPPNPVFADDWVLGKPDLVLEMPEEYTVGPEGEDDYRHFVIPTDFDRDVFIQAADVIPGNRQTVHHVLVYVDTSGKARELDAADPGPGYSRFGGLGFEPVSGLGGWAPGAAPAKAPPGTGRWLPKGADVVMQVHYYRTGVEEKDRTKVGFYFAEADRPAIVRTGIAINHDFVIPPGEQHHRVDASWELDEAIYAISAAPHMHLLGTEMQVTADLPNGDQIPLIWIKQWDFNWQGAYQFRQPLLLPKGTRVNVVAYFDNSTENPNQPNQPPVPVGWGEKTTDEMCIAFIGYLRAAEWQPEAAN